MLRRKKRKMVKEISNKSELRSVVDSSGPQPGEISDPEKYEAAIADGTLGEIPHRNIIFVGDGEPTTAYHGAFSVELPDPETQRKGFYHPQARSIIQQFPKKYKKFVRKGDK